MLRLIVECCFTNQLVIQVRILTIIWRIKHKIVVNQCGKPETLINRQTTACRPCVEELVINRLALFPCQFFLFLRLPLHLRIPSTSAFSIASFTAASRCRVVPTRLLMGNLATTASNAVFASGGSRQTAGQPPAGSSSRRSPSVSSLPAPAIRPSSGVRYCVLFQQIQPVLRYNSRLLPDSKPGGEVPPLPAFR